jgi:hypothetical protein
MTIISMSGITNTAELKSGPKEANILGTSIQITAGNSGRLKKIGR